MDVGSNILGATVKIKPAQIERVAVKMKHVVVS